MAIMSFSIRRTSHTVVPLALRAVATSRILTGSHVNNVLTGEEHGLVHRSNQYFSTAAGPHKLADQEFLKHLKSEIKWAKRDDIQVPEVPENFPFEITNIPGDPGSSIILRRKLAGEKIEVEVNGPYGDDNDSAVDTSDDYDNESDDKSSSTETIDEEEEVPERRKFDISKRYIDLRVKISKENGKMLECVVWANNGSIQVRNIYVDKCDLQYCEQFWMEADWQNSWRAFLARRGVEDGIVDFLMKYIVLKYNRDHLLFLKKLEKFVKE